MPSQSRHLWPFWLLFICAGVLIFSRAQLRESPDRQSSATGALATSGAPPSFDPSRAGAGRLSAMGNPRARFDHQFASWLAAFKSRSKNPEMMWMEGATAEEINQLEQAAGQIPPDLRRLLLTHNGQDQKATPLHFVNRLLSCEEIIHESTELQEINADVGLSPGEIDGTTPIEEAAWWHKNLLLFLSDDNGGGVAVDRQTGAVWDWDHDGGLFGQLAPDIGTFFEWMCLALKEGRYEKEEPIYYPELDPAKVEQQETTAE